MANVAPEHFAPEHLFSQYFVIVVFCSVQQNIIVHFKHLSKKMVYGIEHIFQPKNAISISLNITSQIIQWYPESQKGIPNLKKIKIIFKI